MDKANLIADVRSILRRSLPEPGQSNNLVAGRSAEDSSAGLSVQLDQLSALALNQTNDSVAVLHMATALCRLMPGIHLVLTNLPAAREPEEAFPKPVEATVIPIRSRDQAKAATVRAGVANAFAHSVPSAVEALLSELGVIERQDRSYRFSSTHDLDAITAWAYRQRRREDILAEIRDLKSAANLG